MTTNPEQRAEKPQPNPVCPECGRRIGTVEVATDPSQRQFKLHGQQAGRWGPYCSGTGKRIEADG